MKVLVSSSLTALSLLWSSEAFSVPAPTRSVEAAYKAAPAAPAPAIALESATPEESVGHVDLTEASQITEDAIDLPGHTDNRKHEESMNLVNVSVAASPTKHSYADLNNRWWVNPSGNSAAAVGDASHPDYFQSWPQRGFKRPPPKKNLTQNDPEKSTNLVNVAEASPRKPSHPYRYTEIGLKNQWWQNPYGNSVAAVGDVTHPDYFQFWPKRSFVRRHR